MASCGAPCLPALQFIHESPHLNLYLYPAEADYVRSRPLSPQWHRVDSCVRQNEPPYAVPRELGTGGIYLSLGSLGSADVGLMDRLIGVLGTTRHGVIVRRAVWFVALGLLLGTGATLVTQRIASRRSRVPVAAG
jgi:hypothetical protein